MHSRNVPIPRRSSRVPAALPILVTSTEPDAHFSQLCETLVVSPYGCSMRSPEKLGAGARVNFQSETGRHTLAHIVDCQPLGIGQGWRLGAKLDRPENFWNLEVCPEDWSQLSDIPRLVESAGRKVISRSGTVTQLPEHTVAGKIQEQISDEHLRSIVAELVRPLQTEVSTLKEKVKGDGHRSSFDISLTHIPEEVEEKLWVRLREDLGTQVLHQTKEQSEQLLGAAKLAIDKKMVETETEFRQHMIRELKGVEQRAHGLSDEIGGAVQKHLTLSVEHIQKQASEAENHLSQESEQLLRYLLQRLGEEHNVHRREVQKIETALASELSRLQSQVVDITGRVAGVDESARQLEAELDSRLGQVAEQMISGTRRRLESAAESVLKEFESQGAKVGSEQLEQACERLRNTQQGIEASVVTLLRAQVTETLLSFGQTMEALAQDSVERWRTALARDLSSVSKILGEQVRSEDYSKNNGIQTGATAGA